MTQINPAAIFVKPVITEKTLLEQQSGKYTFLVVKTATKNQIKEAFKVAYGADALKVNTVVVKGQTKINWKNRRTIEKPDFKKAIVTVNKDQKLPVLTLKTEGNK